MRCSVLFLSLLLSCIMLLKATEGARNRRPRFKAGHLFVEEQQRNVEEAWQEQNVKILQEIASLQGDEFNTSYGGRYNNSYGVSMMSVYGGNAKLLWDFFPPIYPCPIVWQVGRLPDTGDGAKYVCGSALLRKAKCLVYSFGSNGQTSFEEDIIRRANCEVHVFDPTMDEESIEKVEAVEGATFHRYGLGGFDGDLEVDNATRTYTEKGAKSPTIAIKKLQTIMKELGHKWIDVLKIDIEGAEYQFLEAYALAGQEIPATQLQVEFHHFHNQITPQQIFATMVNLTSAGNMRPFHSEPNLWWGINGRDFVEYAFLHVDGKGLVMGI